MAVEVRHSYTNGISYPERRLSETSNQLYSDALQDLCRETNYNKLRLKRTLFKTDREQAHDIVRWEFGTPNKAKLKPAWYYNEQVPSWEDEGAVFHEETGKHFACNKCEKENKEAESLCYLCTTLEEHQQHTIRRGVLCKAKKRPRPRVKFIPPPPTVKHKEVEIEEKKDVLYKFSVKTGSHAYAATNANVTVKLKGTKGIMRKKILKKKTSAKFVFGRNTTEVFYIKGPEIGELSMLAIEHDGLEQSHAWYLEEVEVTKMNTEQVWLFVCKEWLSLYHGHGEIKKLLKADHREIEPREFELSVVTGDKMFSGTDANVFVTLYGKKGVSRRLQLKNRSKNPFEKGSTENFFVEVKEDIGPVRKIRMEHDNTGSGPGWLLEQVTVSDLSSGQNYNFPCGQWLATDEGDGQIARDLHPLGRGQKLAKFGPDDREVSAIMDDLDNYKQVVSGSQKSVSSLDSYTDQNTKGKVRGPALRYEVTILTGKVRYAGTDAHVYLTLIGKRGRSSEVELFDNAKDLFEMGQTDVFRIQAEDVGEIKRIQVRHDNSGLGAGWFLEKMNIKRYFTKEEVRERLMKIQGEVQEAVARNMDEIHGDDIESPQQNKSKVTGSVKVKKDTETDDSDDDDDAANIFSTYKKKKSKKKAGSDDESDNSVTKVKKKYQAEKKKFEKKRQGKGRYGNKNKVGSSSSDSEDDSSEDTEDTASDGESKSKKVTKLKKMKWISYGGYRMQVTDDEYGESPKKGYRKKVKYPSDDNSDSEDEKVKKYKRKGIQKKYSKYMSDSEDNDSYTRGRNGRKYKGRDEESDSDENQKGHKKRQGQKKGGYADSFGREDKAFSALYKKNRVPFYDEYLFECQRWLARDEDDGQIDREFKPQSVTTFYKMKE